MKPGKAESLGHMMEKMDSVKRHAEKKALLKAMKTKKTEGKAPIKTTTKAVTTLLSLSPSTPPRTTVFPSSMAYYQHFSLPYSTKKAAATALATRIHRLVESASHQEGIQVTGLDAGED